MLDAETNFPAVALPPPLTIEKWIYGGKGLARWERLAVLVPFVLPGEKAKVRIERRLSGHAEAAPLEIIEPSAARRTPACPYFGRCGGCHYQHSDYAFQLEQKCEILRETLRRTARLAPPEQIEVIAGEPWGYRNRAQFHLKGGALGYLEAASSRFCPVENCPICSPEINQALEVLRRMSRQPRFPHFLQRLEIFSNGREFQLNVLEADRPPARRFFEWCAEGLPGVMNSALDYAAAGYVFRVSRRSFFQVNRFLLDRLVELAVENARGQTAVDLYAGVGLFSLALAGRFERLIAVEAGASAAADLVFNASRNAALIEVHKTTAEAFLSRLERPPDFILADPPRAGLGKPVVRELLRLKPPEIRLVACDPVTLARDLGLLARGGYRLEALTLIDLFPQTYHFETLARVRVE